MKEAQIIPSSVVARLTRYLAHVQRLRETGVEWISSQELADALGLTSSTVRQDLSHVDFSGISKRGYETAGLEGTLAALLGADKEWKVVVVGAGNLGRALALHEEFPRRGYRICGIFDSDPKKIGRKVGRLIIRHIDDLPAVAGADGVEVGIIAVPIGAAQSVADLLILGGVRGILNLTLTHIVAPAHVSVIDSRIVASLQELSHAMTSRTGMAGPAK